MKNTSADATFATERDVYVIGVDEAGRGCLAGPVATAAVCCRLSTASSFCVDDSKKISPLQRAARFSDMCRDLDVEQEEVHKAIARRKCSSMATYTAAAPPPSRSLCIQGFSLCLVKSTVIDDINILNATLEGMANACNDLVVQLQKCGHDLHSNNTIILIDGNRLPWAFLSREERRRVKDSGKNQERIGHAHRALSSMRATTVVGGDACVFSIAAASIVAKVGRDTFVDKVMAVECPKYGFATNKGYGTEQHLEALQRHGVCAYHRLEFEPVAASVKARKRKRKG